MFYTDLAYENWKKKYRYKNETPLETWKRLAKTLASVEKESKRDLWEDRFLKTLIKFDKNGEPIGLKNTTGGRITANAGTGYKKATLINCFINGPVSGAKISYKRSSEDGSVEYPVQIITDNSPDDLMNIFLTIAEQAKTLASEGGYGINFDWIRPRGSFIKGTGIEHPGVVSYMRIWDSVADCIVKGNIDGYVDKIKNYLKDDESFEDLKNTIKKLETRKGAMMGCLSCSHPDIEEFITAKQQKGVLTKFNMSVVIDDEFMRAVEKDDFYDLTFNGKVYKKVKARDLYDLIMESTYNRNEPGVIFVDNVMRRNPVSYLGRINSSNPCGEVPGIPGLTTVCLLGSSNLTQYIFINQDNRPEFDFNLYSDDLRILVRMLDNINDLTYSPLPSYIWAIKNLRQIGIGINGLGSALVMLGIRYGSPESIEFVEKINNIKENITWQESALLAKEKGTFAVYDKEKFENTHFFKTAPLWEETRSLMKKYGVRNAKTTTNPPLGNSSVICSEISNSIECLFMLDYDRKKIVAKWPEGLTSDNIKGILTHKEENDYEYWEGEYKGKRYYYEPHNRGLCTVTTVRDFGYNWLLENFPNKDHSEYLVTSKDLKVKDHIAVQEAVQKHVNQSVSKTINLPNDYPFDEFKEVYLDAWRRGLNGITTYRTGTMESVISELSESKENKGIIEKDIKLPDTFTNGPTRIIKREGVKFYINFSYLPEDIEMKFPIVIWIYTNNKEKHLSSVCNRASRELAKLALKKSISKEIVEETIKKAKVDYPHNRLGRMISLNLRHNVPILDILASLMGIEGDNVSTLLTAVRKFLSEFIEDGSSLKGKGVVCQECGQDSLIFESGCTRCIECGFSGCG